MLQRDTRVKYPGAYSFEFQSVMQILTKCMLKWDVKTQSSKGKGILGTVVAFTGADEEQGRITLHQHWQICIKELIQTLQDCLFDKDATERYNAQTTFCQHINNITSASYGPDLCITHKCINGDENKQLKIDIANNLFRDKEPSYFRRARHKELHDEVKGGICTVLTVMKPYLQLILSTRLCNDGKIVFSLVIERNITDQTQSFHYHKKDWIWLLILSHTT